MQYIWLKPNVQADCRRIPCPEQSAAARFIADLAAYIELALTMKAVTYYDPNTAPDAREWLALDEHERIRLAKNYHEAARIKLPDSKTHAIFHAVVENQIAEGFGPSCRALERLEREGLSRHDAVHAIGSVVAKFAFDSLHTPDGKSANDTQRELNIAIEALSASAWKRGGL